MGGTKPKGLSIRSNSDISHGTPPVSQKNICHNKEQDYPKLKVTQTDNSGRPISPGKEIKKLIAQPSKCKESAAKEETAINKSTKIQLAGDLFKKPIPKKSTKILSEPEKLAYWYNDEREFYYKYIEMVEKRLFSKS